MALVWLCTPGKRCVGDVAIRVAGNDPGDLTALLVEVAHQFTADVNDPHTTVVECGIQQLILLVYPVVMRAGVRYLKAGDLIKPIAAVVGGGGGGRPNMAQAGGKDSSKLPEALDKARELLAQ